MDLVSTQKLSMYSTSTRAKLTLRQDVVGKITMLFPPELQNSGKAELIMFVEGRSPEFAVTASLQKQGENGVRVVLLESGWKPVVRKLGLKKGDTVSIFLSHNPGWTYSIQVERAPEADPIHVDAMVEDVVVEEATRRMEIDLNEPAHPDTEINLKDDPIHVDAMVDDVVVEEATRRMQIDLNQPPLPD